MKRKAFIDWSGNYGFKFELGVSKFLAFALVICDDYMALREALAQFKRARHFPRSFELHYHQSPVRLRSAFFEWLATHPSLANIAVLVVNKKQLPIHFREYDAIDTTSYFVAQTVALASQQITGAHLLIDGDRKHVALQRHIRKTLSRAGYRLDNVQLRDSHLEDGIQIADMVAGAALDDLQGQSEWFSLIRRGVVYQKFEWHDAE